MPRPLREVLILNGAIVEPGALARVSGEMPRLQTISEAQQKKTCSTERGCTYSETNLKN